MAETFQDFIVRDRERLHAERERNVSTIVRQPGCYSGHSTPPNNTEACTDV
jgi:hypothetical protein